MIVDSYLANITPVHRTKPKYVSTVKATLAPLLDVRAMLEGMGTAFDLDSATGNQLDILGEWIGFNRNIKAVIEGVFFEWNSPDASVGWNQGNWKDRYDSLYGISKLPDDAYRLMLRMKIAANTWDGTLDHLYDIWSILFPKNHIIIEDFQDMSLSVIFTGFNLSNIMRQAILLGLLPLKPMGVHISYAVVENTLGKLFAWNTGNETLSGWASGHWPKTINEEGA